MIKFSESVKPNIFFLVLDGFRGDLCFGKNKTSITPNIDKLVKNGIYFKQAISSGMSSTPSVSSILTSLYPFESLVQDGKLFKINPKITTYVEELRDEGYSTHAIIQKPLSHIGFEKIFSDKLETYDHTKEKIWTGLGERVREKIKHLKNKEPWFCYVQLYDLNLLIYPRDVQIKNGPKEIEDPKFGKNSYERIISAQDKWIGKIIDEIDFEKTLLIFTSDHGLESGAYDKELEKFDIEQRIKRKVEPGLSFKMGMKMKTIIPYRKKFAEKYKDHIAKIKEEKQKPENDELQKLEIQQYRKRLMELSIMPKSNIFDDRIHVPLIFHGYNSDSPKIINMMVRSVDIFPTILDICGLKNDLSKRRGRSLNKLISNEDLDEKPVFIESSVNVVKSPDSNVIGIRTGEFKYFRDREISNKNINLFNLRNDPLEEHNIAEENPEMVEFFENELKSISPKLDFKIKENDQDEIGEDEAKEIEEKLREAGYIN